MPYGDDEAVLFVDAVHPTHAARPAGCWAPSQEKLAIQRTDGRERINIHVNSWQPGCMKRWPVGSSVMRRPLVPPPNRPTPRTQEMRRT